MTLQQLIDLLIEMRTEENRNSSILLKNIEDGKIPFIKAVLDKKYHIELTNQFVGSVYESRN